MIHFSSVCKIHITLHAISTRLQTRQNTTSEQRACARREQTIVLDNTITYCRFGKNFCAKIQMPGTHNYMLEVSVYWAITGNALLDDYWQNVVDLV